MKKLIFSMLFVALAAIFSANVNASCPSGAYTQDTVVITYGDCEFKVVYCYSSEPTGVLKTSLSYLIFDLPLSDSCMALDLSDPEFWDNITMEIFTHVDTSGNHEFPPCTGLNPMSVNVEYENAACMMKVSWAGGEGIIGECDLEPGRCIKYYQVCWLGSELRRTLIDSDLIDAGNCFIAGDPINLPLYECFNICE